jgi:NAD-dependent dihydropyrimidine dehydrogenase PreA subunit
VNKSEEKIFTIVQEKCIKCGACFTACPEKFMAVIKVPSYTIKKQSAGAGTLAGTKA